MNKKWKGKREVRGKDTGKKGKGKGKKGKNKRKGKK